MQCFFRPHKRPTELHVTPEEVADTPPSFYVGPSPDPSLPHQSSLEQSPQPSTSVFIDPGSPVSKKLVIPVFTVGQTSQTTQQPSVATTSKQAPTTPTSSKSAADGNSRRSHFSRSATTRERRQLQKMDSRSRLPSISHLQEKLRKRWPRTMRVTGSGAGGRGEGAKGKRSSKHWMTAPRLVSYRALWNTVHGFLLVLHVFVQWNF